MACRRIGIVFHHGVENMTNRQQQNPGNRNSAGKGQNAPQNTPDQRDRSGQQQGGRDTDTPDDEEE
jgi:hypothetical protein